MLWWVKWQRGIEIFKTMQWWHKPILWCHNAALCCDKASTRWHNTTLFSHGTMLFRQNTILHCQNANLCYHHKYPILCFATPIWSCDGRYRVASVNQNSGFVGANEADVELMVMYLVAVDVMVFGLSRRRSYGLMRQRVSILKSIRVDVIVSGHIQCRCYRFWGQ